MSLKHKKYDWSDVVVMIGGERVFTNPITLEINAAINPKGELVTETKIIKCAVKDATYKQLIEPKN